MSNTNKDFVSDYFNQYPVFRYILPGLLLNGKNITNNVYMARQACWVLAQIYNDSNNYSVINPGAGAYSQTLFSARGVINSNMQTTDGVVVSKADIELLGIFLAVAAAAVNANPNATHNAIVANRDVAYANSLATPPANYTALLTALVDNSSTSGVGLTSDKATALGVLAGITAGGMATTNVAGLHAAIQLELNKLNTFNPPQYTGLTYNNYEISTPAATNLLFTRDLFAPTAGSYLSPISGNGADVYLIANMAQHSYLGAINRHVRPSNQYRYEFYQDKSNGVFQLRKYGPQGVEAEDFSRDFDKLVGANSFCKAFGVQSSTPNENVVCGQMIASCLGETTSDATQCRAHFKGLTDVSDHLRGWNVLADEQKRYMAYRVLNGLAIPPNLTKNGNYSYYDDNGNLIYSKDHLFSALNLAGTTIPGGAAGSATAANSKHVAYVVKLMELVGTIETKRKVGDNRPTHASFGRPTFITVPSVFVRSPGIMPMLPMMGFSRMGVGMAPMFGGSEVSNTTIQYGGNSADVRRIVDAIRNKIAILNKNGSGLSSDKIRYIDAKLNNLMSIGNEIETFDSILSNAISMANQYGPKEIIFSPNDLSNFKAKLEQSQAKLASKIGKIEQLGLVLSKM
jgi:hypothetical protein